MSDPQLNVLLLADRFEVRGSSTYTLRLARNLGEYGVRASVVSPDVQLVETDQRDPLSIAEYTHFCIPLWGRVVMRTLLNDLKDDPPDLIHVQSRSMLSYGTRLARRLGRPLVMTVHDYLGPHERMRFHARYGQRIIAVSESVKSELLNRTRVSEGLITVIHGGVESACDQQLPPVLDPGHVPVIGTAGPLEAAKGLPYFLGAVKRVLSVDANVEFLISGTGPDEGNLRRLAQQLAIDEKVTFVPNLLDFSKSLAAMDVFCLPSLQQGFGTIMLEAMALAKPVIASGVGGVDSVIRDNETGLVVPPSESGPLADRIIELLRDPVRARAIGEAGRQLVHDEFGVEKMVRQTADVYHDVLAGTDLAA